PSSLEISEGILSFVVPVSHALAADSTTFQSNAAELSVLPQIMSKEEEERHRKAQQLKATEERRKRRKKAHARMASTAGGYIT
ncbi:hypothetical protein C0993_006347, partial [Termitomyces sp. T159_Od127]